jgi:hypothetical protein
MAMFCIRKTPMRAAARQKLIVAGASVAGLLSLAACATEPLSPDFGVALKQDLVAQIADPDARYGVPPDADGARTALAQDRYRTGKVIEPSGLGASKVGGEAAETDGGKN